MASGLRVCIVAQTVPGAGALGGAERQCLMIAEGLAARGHDVVLLGSRRGPAEPVERSERLRIESWTGGPEQLEHALRRHRAEVCYVRDIERFAPAVQVCARLGVRSIVAFYSLPQCGGWRGRLLAQAVRALSPSAIRGWYRDGKVLEAAHGAARRADVRIAQTIEQRDALRRIRIDARVVPNIQPVATPPSDGHRADVLWVGKPFKRPGLFLDLAERLSADGRRFVFACRLSEASRREAALLARVRSLPGVVHLHDATEDELAGAYASAAVLVNTSVVEGFPNTFLEAWSAGVPVVSLDVDPDGVLEAEAIGVSCGGSLAALTEAVRGFLEKPARREDFGSRARAYVRRVHAPEVILPSYERVLAGEGLHGYEGTA